MPSVWIRARPTKSGDKRFQVEYRLGGRGTRIRYGGVFKRQRDAQAREKWISGELAALHVPDLSLRADEPPKAPTLADACDAWRASRVDVEEQTRRMHRSDLARIFKVAPPLRSKRLDALTVDDVTALVAALTEAGYKRDTISKSRDALAMTLDHHGVEPNVARDKRVKLPKERRPHIAPPLAEHVERVAELLPRHHVLPLLIVDECGPRVNELATAQVGDLDEHRRAIRVRATVEKNDLYRHLDLPDDLFDALIATLPPREDRDLEAPLFPDLTDARLEDRDHEGVQGDRDAALLAARPPTSTRLAALQAHVVARRRRRLLGDSKRVAADHYVYALTDYREVDRSIALARAFQSLAVLG